MTKRTSTIKATLLAWLAFVGTFLSTAGLILTWPWIRGANPNDAGSVMVSISSAILFTSVALGLAVRDYVLRYFGVRTGAKNSSKPASGCAFVAVPASLIAFFCTCAPVGLVSIAERSVQPSEKNWGDELWIAGWVLGLLSAAGVIIRKRRDSTRDK